MSSQISDSICDRILVGIGDIREQNIDLPAGLEYHSEYPYIMWDTDQKIGPFEARKAVSFLRSVVDLMPKNRYGLQLGEYIYEPKDIYPVLNNNAVLRIDFYFPFTNTVSCRNFIDSKDYPFSHMVFDMFSLLNLVQLGYLVPATKDEAEQAVRSLGYKTRDSVLDV